MTPPELRQHVVVVGADTTAVRLVEEMVRAGEHLVVIGHGRFDPSVVTQLERLGAEVIVTAHVEEADLDRAGVRRAKAAVILGDDDVVAVRVALAIEEMRPECRLVLEMSNPTLGEKLAPLLGDCTVLSSAELAAPAFVAAALATAETTSFELGGRLVAAGPRTRVGGELLAVIGDSRLRGIDAVLPHGDGDIVLGTEVTGSPRRPVRQSGMFGALTQVFDRRLRFVVIGLVSLIVISTLYFHLDGSDWVTSLYRALTASTDTGLDVDNLTLSFRFGAVAIQLFGLVLSSGITAVIVDALISSRLAALTGGVRGRPRHHVVVCGLGRIGTSVAVRLKTAGVPVVAIERYEDAIGVLRARRLKIPVIIAPASDVSAQEVAGIGRADAVLAVTDDEAVNLEIGLVAKHANPDVRVVTRLFDHDLAGRVERRLELGATRSVSMLAAPAFAAAALGRRKEVIFPIGRRVLLFTEVTVSPESSAPGKLLSAVEESGACKVLAIAVHGSETWSWDAVDRELSGGDRLAVVATRAGLARLLLSTKRISTPPPKATVVAAP
ncbi:MAG: NAD-binding protein [Propionibacteriaceae bacterium]